MAIYDRAKLRAWREESGLRREQVCAPLGLSAAWLARLEGGYGARSSPSIDTLARLAEFYGHQVGELFPTEAEPAEAVS